jgi:hypothetical protein
MSDGARTVPPLRTEACAAARTGREPPPLAPRQPNIVEQAEATREAFVALTVQAKQAADESKLARIFVTTEVSPNRPPEAQRPGAGDA